MKTPFAIAALIAVLTTPLIAVEQAVWIPPSEDLVGTSSVPAPNGINDWHIRVSSDRLGGVGDVSWRVRGGLWYSMVDIGAWYAPDDPLFPWSTLLKVDRSGTQADLHFDPLLAWPGDVFEVHALVSSEKKIVWRTVSNGEGWLPKAAWLGQGDRDVVGPAEHSSDGIRDWIIRLEHPFLSKAPALVDVWLPYRPMGSRLSRVGCFDYWSSHDRRSGMPLSVDSRSGVVTLSINPVLACGGDEFFVRIAWPDKSWNMWKAVGMGSEWATGGSWFGQDEQDYVGQYDASRGNGVRDWHLAVESPKLVSPVRWMVRGAKCVWESVEPGKKRTEPASMALMPLVRGSQADLYFEPAMERAGDTFYVTAVLADGSLVNWGVTSTRQVRGNDVSWLGQTPDVLSARVDGAVTNMVSQWCISVSDERLAAQSPYRWSVSSGANKWRTPRESDTELKEFREMHVSAGQGAARLFIDPVWARPGDQFDIQASLPDGTIVQWTALADGAEWARAGQWLSGDSSDYVGIDAAKGPDQQPDLAVRISDDRLRDPLARLEITGNGWRWLWPETAGVSPVHIQFEGGDAVLHFAPGPQPAENAFTIKAIFSTGFIKYWQAIKPEPPAGK
ncbi:hypothetical protein GX586_03365 [bacterium]|nr:hypothetical protein [bacterium]